MKAAVGDHVAVRGPANSTPAAWPAGTRSTGRSPSAPASCSPALLLSSKGDRVAMHSSVETRYPFLDEDVIAFLARLHPRWKLHGLTDKYVLRLLAERWLPKSIAWRKKAMFRAPMDASTWKTPRRSSTSCSATSRFARRAISTRRRSTTGGAGSRRCGPARRTRTAVEMGLVGVMATQLWHQTFIDSGPGGRAEQKSSPR